METVIVDAGPLVAYLRKDDADHDWAVERFQELRDPLRTCDAALSEAVFLLQRTRSGAGPLLELLERGVVLPEFNLRAELPPLLRLLRRYNDVPMSVADGCLVRNGGTFRGLDGLYLGQRLSNLSQAWTPSHPADLS